MLMTYYQKLLLQSRKHLDIREKEKKMVKREKTEVDEYIEKGNEGVREEKEILIRDMTQTLLYGLNYACRCW
jgi:CHASE3 domain sensor protein